MLYHFYITKRALGIPVEMLITILEPLNVISWNVKLGEVTHIWSPFQFGYRVVGWGAMLQAGRSQVWFPMQWLDFSIDVILSAALWPWCQLIL
jgi:hypothetical protein